MNTFVVVVTVPFFQTLYSSPVEGFLAIEKSGTTVVVVVSVKVLVM